MSPVDKGLYRASHTLTIYEPSAAAPYGEDATGGKMAKEAGEQMQKALATLADGLKIPNKGLSVFITNNLTYASALEHGSSLQAPAGVYALVEKLAEHYIKKAEAGG
jgi:hypothetical protein